MAGGFSPIEGWREPLLPNGDKEEEDDDDAVIDDNDEAPGTAKVELLLMLDGEDRTGALELICA